MVHKYEEAAEVKSLTKKRNVHNWCPEGTKQSLVHIMALSQEQSIRGKNRGRQQAVCE